MANTNDYIVDDVLGAYENKYLDQVNRILSMHHNGRKASKEYIIKNRQFSQEEQLIFLEILDVLDNVNTGGKVRTTNFDGKVYSMVFIREFLEFLRNPENNFTFSEFKLLLTLYEFIVDASKENKCLIGLPKKTIAEKAGIDYKNLSKIFNGLQKKDIIKIDENGGIYINCKYFFFGDSLKYDLYKVKYGKISQ